MRPLLRWYGGKFILAEKIIRVIDDSEEYYETHFGGGSILLNKPRSQHEAANDINQALIETWKVVRDTPEILLDHLMQFNYSEESFNEAERMLDSANPLDFAAGFIIRNRMSYAGLGTHYTWTEETRRSIPRQASMWETFLKEGFMLVANRVRNVHFTCLDFTIALANVTNPEAVVYIDPPYLQDSRATKNVYKHEMNRLQHQKLLSMVVKHPSKIFISGFHSNMYDDALKDWTCYEFDVAINVSRKETQSRRTECLWVNRQSLLAMLRE